jgi:far upstream element-binding protein
MLQRFIGLHRLVIAQSSSSTQQLFLRNQTFPKSLSTSFVNSRVLFSTSTQATAATGADNKQQASSPNGAPVTTSSGEIEDTITVPRQFVRFLIGLKGAKLREFSEKSGGGRVNFSKQVTSGGDESASIVGTQEQVTKLKEMLHAEVERMKKEGLPQPKTATEGGFSGRSASASGGSGDYMEEVIVDAQYVGLLIGKQGTVLKEMESQSGAGIQYSGRDDDQKERTARIRGTPEQVQAAKKLISERIYEIVDDMRNKGRVPSRRDGSQPRNFRQRGAQSGEAEAKQVVEVPTECVGALIGKGGKSLFEMQDRTGAKFTFAKDDHREGAREVVIVGSEEQIRLACDMVQKRVRQILEKIQASETGA